MRPRRRSNTRLATAVLLGLAALAATVAVAIAAAPAAAPAGGQARAPRSAALTSLDSCDGLRAYYARHRRAVRSYGYVGMPAEGGIATDEVPTAPPGGAPTPAPSAPTSSPTNVQEVGVDEPDIVKAAGSTIFTVDGDTLRAVDASADTPVLAGTLKLPQGPGEDASVSDYQLLLAGDRLLAIGSSYAYAVPVADGVVGPDIAYASPSEMIVAEIDISDPAAMHVVRSMSVEGSYVSARLTGSTVRLVTSDYPSPGVLDAESGHGRALVPKMTIRDRTTGKRRRAKLVRCDAVSHPSRFAGAEMVSVLTIDMQRGLPAVDVDSVLTDGQIVYASPTALYVATERWMDPAPDAAEPPSSTVDTEIHRFDISDPDSTAYVASGKVSGYMLSQWSMSEQDGLLRVASTSSPPFTDDGDQVGDSESFVTVLAADGDRLTQVGKVGGLGRGEQIYAVRFIGDAGYVVTFHQVDPLYTLDLSDPTAPRVVGELKIPGYSAYLHPVGPGLLLGIGQDAGAGGQTSGLQASLFDVSDPANPVRIDREAFGAGSSSEVEYDHHAFSWFDADALAILPLDSYSYSYGTSGEFHGAVGLRVDPGGADPLGRVAKISHGSSYESQIRRSLELGDRVYTVAADGIADYDPATLALLGSLAY
jgi:uncharacterized secreted protein with C-terminal beta-propeller domain